MSMCTVGGLLPLHWGAVSDTKENIVWWLRNTTENLSLSIVLMIAQPSKSDFLVLSSIWPQRSTSGSQSSNTLPLKINNLLNYYLTIADKQTHQPFCVSASTVTPFLSVFTYMKIVMDRQSCSGENILLITEVGSDELLFVSSGWLSDLQQAYSMFQVFLFLCISLTPALKLLSPHWPNDHDLTNRVVIKITKMRMLIWMVMSLTWP